MNLNNCQYTKVYFPIHRDVTSSHWLGLGSLRISSSGQTYSSQILYKYWDGNAVYHHLLIRPILCVLCRDPLRWMIGSQILQLTWQRVGWGTWLDDRVISWVMVIILSVVGKPDCSNLTALRQLFYIFHCHWLIGDQEAIIILLYLNGNVYWTPGIGAQDLWPTQMIDCTTVTTPTLSTPFLKFTTLFSLTLHSLPKTLKHSPQLCMECILPTFGHYLYSYICGQ